MRALVIALALLAPLTALSAEKSRYCTASAAKQIDRPVYPGEPGRKETFRYTYSRGQGGDEGFPLVVVLPGGPGQGAIPMPLALPAGAPVLRIDPRGVGCNDDPALPAEALRSDYAATDVIAAIQAERPGSYILYGASYGTLLATHVAAQIEAAGLPPPKAIVLEGVLGRAFRKGEYMEGALQRWAEVREQLSPELRAELSRNPLPFGRSAHEWAAYIASLLYVGVPAGAEVDNAVEQLGRMNNPAQRPFVEKRIAANAGAPAADRLRVFREITCREIANDMRDLQFDYDLLQGNLVPRDTGFCDGIRFEQAFDAAAHPIRTPIYYFSGALDPATPPVQARYHFAHQTKAARTFVSLKNGGHLPLSLNMGDCNSGVWQAIAKGADLRPALQSCMAEPKATVEFAPAE